MPLLGFWRGAGSRSLERYTGPQIRKIYETDAETYHATERVSLVSSFMASLLVGDYVAIDHSDAAGMTLMNLRDRTWSPEALNVSTMLLALCSQYFSIFTLIFIKSSSFSSQLLRVLVIADSIVSHSTVL